MNFFSLAKIRHTVSLLFFTIFISYAIPCATAGVTLTFLSVNDIYDIKGSNGSGGFARLKAALDKERSESKNSITTVCGDFLGPSMPSLQSEGRIPINLLEDIGVNYVVLGNHEFDFGPKVLASRIEESRFRWLGANVKDLTGKLFPGVEAHALIDINGIKVGILGVTTPETQTLSTPGPNVKFHAVVETAKNAVAELKAQNVDVIVALTHLSLEEDLELAREVKGIHLILGGHDHFPATLMRYGTLISKSGHDAHYLARIDLEVDKSSGTIEVTPSWKMIPLKQTREDLALSEKISKALISLNDDWMDAEVLLEAELDSCQDTISTKENKLGNLVTDYIRNDLKADCVILNAGYLRGDALIPSNTILQVKDLLKLVPFPDEIVLAELTGDQLLRALEHSLSRTPASEKIFPQISGLRVTYDSRKSPGARVISAYVGDKLLETKAKYRFATLDYLYQGGAGFTSFAEGRLLDDAHPSGPIGIRLVKALANKGKVETYLDGRIKDVAAQEGSASNSSQ